MIEIKRADAVGHISLNKPQTRNALSRPLIAALSRAIEELEASNDIHALLLSGGPPFCAGADISEIQDITLAQALAEDFSGCCDRLGGCAKPVVAAVEGYALGGGCELIEMCDIVVAAENARIGHPEITLGTLSGGGGTQRLARAVGRAKAMDLVLTGSVIPAPEAEKIGLISRVVAPGRAVEAGWDIARQIAARPPFASRFAKEAVHRAVSAGLEEGLRLERRLFHLSFATGELHDGMRQFLTSRSKP